MTPIFEIFYPIGSIFYATSQSAEKITLSLSHLVPEIRGPTVGLFFHPNVLFNSV